MILLRRRKTIRPIGGNFSAAEKAYMEMQRHSKQVITKSHGVPVPVGEVLTSDANGMTSWEIAPAGPRSMPTPPSQGKIIYC